MNTEDLLAREAIRHTQAAYHLAGDRGRVDDLVAVFAEDGVLEIPTGVHAGRQAIRAALSAVRVDAPAPTEIPGFLHHHLTTTHVELDGPDAATGTCYFLVMSPVGVDHCGRYADRYVRVDGEWLIARRRATVSWASPDSVVGAKVTARAGAPR
jgi:hypothetical protein